MACRNFVGVGSVANALPRVGRSSQPWAVAEFPVGENAVTRSKDFAQNDSGLGIEDHLIGEIWHQSHVMSGFRAAVDRSCLLFQIAIRTL